MLGVETNRYLPCGELWREAAGSPAETLQRLLEGRVFDLIKLLIIEGFGVEWCGAGRVLAQILRLHHLDLADGAIAEEAVDAANDSGRFIL
jgi:hypothetical protein